MLKFDPLARRKYLTGFRKRKQARQWQGMQDVLERERQDKIELRKDHREGIKQRWKDLQRAEALTNRSFAVRGIMDDPKKSKKQMALQDEESDSEKAPVTVAFEKEEDDPFGDCEVTTTAFEASSSTGPVSANAEKLWPALQHTNITSAWTGGRGTWDEENEENDEVAAARFVKQRRRATVRKQEENRQWNALQKRIGKKLGIKKSQKKGGKAPTKAGGKSTHAQRKKEAQHSKRKSGK